MRAHRGRSSATPAIPTSPIRSPSPTILAGYRLDTASIVTALLHDVVEDTSVGVGRR